MPAQPAQPRLVLTALPLIAWLSYHALTVLICFYGPLYWPIDDYGPLVWFLGLSNLMFCVGYVSGSVGAPRRGSSRAPSFYFKAGAILTLLLFVPSLYIYTGKVPTEIAGALADQGQAWSDSQARMVETDGSRTRYAAVKSLFAPLTLAVVPLLFVIWLNISLRWKILGLAALGCTVAFSLARGTDKETVEIGLFFLLGVFVLWIRSRQRWSRKLAQLMLVVVVATIAITGVLNLFVVRKTARLGDVETYCQPVTEECADYDNRLLGWLPEQSKGAGAVVVNYLAQGYYGLSLALEEPFDSTFGLGHSAFLIAQYQRAFGIDDFLSRSYVVKINDKGWPRKTSWSTAYTWIANDIGFAGAAAIMFVFGFVFAKAWRDCIYADNAFAYLVVAIFVMTLFFMPMNFQITQTADYYFAAIVWLFGWWATRRKPMPRRARRGAIS